MGFVWQVPKVFGGARFDTKPVRQTRSELMRIRGFRPAGAYTTLAAPARERSPLGKPVRSSRGPVGLGRQAPKPLAGPSRDSPPGLPSTRSAAEGSSSSQVPVLTDRPPSRVVRTPRPPSKDVRTAPPIPSSRAPGRISAPRGGAATLNLGNAVSSTEFVGAGPPSQRRHPQQ